MPYLVSCPHICRVCGRCPVPDTALITKTPVWSVDWIGPTFVSLLHQCERISLCCDCAGSGA